MKIYCYLLIFSLPFFNCNSRKDYKLSKLFYGLPIYEGPKAIQSKLIRNDQFMGVHSKSLPDEMFIGLNDLVNYNLLGVYNYVGEIKNPILPKHLSKPDSSKIDFTYTISVNKNITTDTITVKIFQIDYFLSNSAEIEELYNHYFKDLKSFSSKEEDISTEYDHVETGKGTKITYFEHAKKSQSIVILKKVFPNGSKSLRLQLLMI